MVQVSELPMAAQSDAEPVKTAKPLPPTKPQKFKLSAKSRRNIRKGAALVEFAFIAPLLFFLILGMIEFGRVMMVQQMLTNGAREGARKAVLASTNSTSTVESTVNSYMSAAGISGHTTTCTPAPSSSVNAGDSMTVSISVRYGQVSLLGDATLAAMNGVFAGINFGTIGSLKDRQLAATVVMAREASSD